MREAELMGQLDKGVLKLGGSFLSAGLLRLLAFASAGGDRIVRGNLVGTLLGLANYELHLGVSAALHVPSNVGKLTGINSKLDRRALLASRAFVALSCRR